MLEFRNPELSDRAWVTGVMERSGDMACEYCLNIFNPTAGTNDIVFHVQEPPVLRNSL